MNIIDRIESTYQTTVRKRLSPNDVSEGNNSRQLAEKALAKFDDTPVNYFETGMGLCAVGETRMALVRESDNKIGIHDFSDLLSDDDGEDVEEAQKSLGRKDLRIVEKWATSGGSGNDGGTRLMYQGAMLWTKPYKGAASMPLARVSGSSARVIDYPSKAPAGPGFQSLYWRTVQAIKDQFGEQNVKFVKDVDDLTEDNQEIDELTDDDELEEALIRAIMRDNEDVNDKGSAIAIGKSQGFFEQDGEKLKLTDKGVEAAKDAQKKEKNEEDDMTEERLEEALSRRHFVAVAQILRDAPIDPEGRHQLASQVAQVFQDENPSFNRERFMAAAGVETGESLDEDQATSEDSLELDEARVLDEPGYIAKYDEQPGKTRFKAQIVFPDSRDAVTAQEELKKKEDKFDDLEGVKGVGMARGNKLIVYFGKYVGSKREAIRAFNKLMRGKAKLEKSTAAGPAQGEVDKVQRTRDGIELTIEFRDEDTAKAAQESLKRDDRSFPEIKRSKKKITVTVRFAESKREARKFVNRALGRSIRVEESLDEAPLNESASRKHFKRIAKILASTHMDDSARFWICDQLIDLFQRENLRFDPERFRQEAGCAPGPSKMEASEVQDAAQAWLSLVDSSKASDVLPEVRQIDAAAEKGHDRAAREALIKLEDKLVQKLELPAAHVDESTASVSELTARVYEDQSVRRDFLDPAVINLTEKYQRMTYDNDHAHRLFYVVAENALSGHGPADIHAAADSLREDFEGNVSSGRYTAALDESGSDPEDDSEDILEYKALTQSERKKRAKERRRPDAEKRKRNYERRKEYKKKRHQILRQKRKWRKRTKSRRKRYNEDAYQDVVTFGKVNGDPTMMQIIEDFDQMARELGVGTDVFEMNERVAMEIPSDAADIMFSFLDSEDVNYELDDAVTDWVESLPASGSTLYDVNEGVVAVEGYPGRRADYDFKVVLDDLKDAKALHEYINKRHKRDFKSIRLADEDGNEPSDPEFDETLDMQLQLSFNHSGSVEEAQEWLEGIIQKSGVDESLIEQRDLSKEQKTYRAIFNRKLKEWGISDPGDLSPDKRKKFFNEIEREWYKDDQSESLDEQSGHPRSAGVSDWRGKTPRLNVPKSEAVKELDKLHNADPKLAQIAADVSRVFSSEGAGIESSDLQAAGIDRKYVRRAMDNRDTLAKVNQSGSHAQKVVATARVLGSGVGESLDEAVQDVGLMMDRGEPFGVVLTVGDQKVRIPFSDASKLANYQLTKKQKKFIKDQYERHIGSLPRELKSVIGESADEAKQERIPHNYPRRVKEIVGELNNFGYYVSFDMPGEGFEITNAQGEPLDVSRQVKNERARDLIRELEGLTTESLDEAEEESSFKFSDKSDYKKAKKHLDTLQRQADLSDKQGKVSYDDDNLTIQTSGAKGFRKDVKAALDSLDIDYSQKAVKSESLDEAEAPSEDELERIPYVSGDAPKKIRKVIANTENSAEGPNGVYAAMEELIDLIYGSMYGTNAGVIDQVPLWGDANDPSFGDREYIVLRHDNPSEPSLAFDVRNKKFIVASYNELTRRPNVDMSKHANHGVMRESEDVREALNLPKGASLPDYYHSGTKLAEDLVRAVGEQNAVSILAEEEDNRLVRRARKQLGEEKWAQNVDVEAGKMHRVLGVPQDKQIEDVYDSGEKLARDLVKAVGEKEAAGMINYAANLGAGQLYKDAQDALKKINGNESVEEAHDEIQIEGWKIKRDPRRSKTVWAERGTESQSAVIDQDGVRWDNPERVPEKVKKALREKGMRVFDESLDEGVAEEAVQTFRERLKDRTEKGVTYKVKPNQSRDVFWYKDGKVAKATGFNPSYDFANNRIRVKDLPKDTVLYVEKAKQQAEDVNEYQGDVRYATKEDIAAAYGTNTAYRGTGGEIGFRNSQGGYDWYAIDNDTQKYVYIGSSSGIGSNVTTMDVGATAGESSSVEFIVPKSQVSHFVEAARQAGMSDDTEVAENEDGTAYRVEVPAEVAQILQPLTQQLEGVTCR